MGQVYTQTWRSVKQNQEPRNKPRHLWATENKQEGPPQTKARALTPLFSHLEILPSF